MVCKDNHVNATEPSLFPTSLAKGVRLINITLTVDEWFQVTTGISGQTNNWLLMVEQAANMTMRDCVVWALDLYYK